MLKRPVGRAPHDELLRAVVEEHADDVVGGDDVGERAAEHLAGALGRGPRPHAGAVVAPYTDHAGAKPFRQHRSSIRRENPALRVAADVEPAALRDGARGLTLKISRGRALCPRHAEAQHEVLFPADEAVVRAAKRNVRASVGQVDGQGGELERPFVVGDVDVVAHHGAAEARGLAERPNEAVVDGGERADPRRDVLPRRARKERLAGPAHAQPRESACVRDAAEIEV